MNNLIRGFKLSKQYCASTSKNIAAGMANGAGSPMGQKNCNLNKYGNGKGPLSKKKTPYPSKPPKNPKNKGKVEEGVECHNSLTLPT